MNSLEFYGTLSTLQNETTLNLEKTIDRNREEIRKLVADKRDACPEELDWLNDAIAEHNQVITEAERIIAARQERPTRPNIATVINSLRRATRKKAKA